MSLWITLLSDCYQNCLVVGSDRRIVLLVAEIPTTEGLKMLKTAQQIIEENKKFIEDNNLKSWNEIHAKVLEKRLESKVSA